MPEDLKTQSAGDDKGDEDHGGTTSDTTERKDAFDRFMRRIFDDMFDDIFGPGHNKFCPRSGDKDSPGNVPPSV